MKNLPEIRGEYRYNFNLAALTWFKAGGCAEVLFKPADIDDLAHFLKNLDKEIQVYILGAGSNIIVRDGGIDGVVVKLGRGFSEINILTHESPYTLLRTGAATLNYNLSQVALQNDLQGLEFLIGIPGTVGGGIAMNAGAYGAEFKDILHSVTLLDRNGKKHILTPEELGFGYRNNSLKYWAIFVEATFLTTLGNKKDIKDKMETISSARQHTQPINQKTGGSTFANPDGHKAWELVDHIGMRGFSIGGAQFSPLHCNFIINTGNATATELEDLGEMARIKVLEKTGIELRWEIKRIGKR